MTCEDINLLKLTSFSLITLLYNYSSEIKSGEIKNKIKIPGFDDLIEKYYGSGFYHNYLFNLVEPLLDFTKQYSESIPDDYIGILTSTSDTKIPIYKMISTAIEMYCQYDKLEYISDGSDMYEIENGIEIIYKRLGYAHKFKETVEMHNKK